MHAEHAVDAGGQVRLTSLSSASMLLLGLFDAALTLGCICLHIACKFLASSTLRNGVHEGGMLSQHAREATAP